MNSLAMQQSENIASFVAKIQSKYAVLQKVICSLHQVVTHSLHLKWHSPENEHQVYRTKTLSPMYIWGVFLHTIVSPVRITHMNEEIYTIFQCEIDGNTCCWEPAWNKRRLLSWDWTTCWIYRHHSTLQYLTQWGGPQLLTRWDNFQFYLMGEKCLELQVSPKGPHTCVVLFHNNE